MLIIQFSSNLVIFDCLIELIIYSQFILSPIFSMFCQPISEEFDSHMISIFADIDDILSISIDWYECKEWLSIYLIKLKSNELKYRCSSDHHRKSRSFASIHRYLLGSIVHNRYRNGLVWMQEATIDLPNQR